MAKRAAPAYWIWLGEQRSSIIEQYDLAGKKSSEVSKKAGEVWKAMAPAEKTKWEDLAVKDRARYEKEVKTLGKRRREPKPDKDAKRARKDPNAPKKPVTPYFAWLADNRKELAEKYKLVRVAEVMKKAAEVWNGLAAEDKAPYEETAEVARAQYGFDLAAYKASVAATGRAAAEEKGMGQGRGEEVLVIPKKVLDKADKASLADTLKRLLARDDVRAKGVAAEDALAALEAAGGSMHKARWALCGEVPDIPKTVLDKADKAGMADTLKRLLARDDVKAQNVKAKDALAALEAARGGLHKARQALSAAVPDIPKAVLDKADQAGMADALKRLLARDDVKAKSVTAKDALAALEAAGGGMHKARKAMLGA